MNTLAVQQMQSSAEKYLSRITSDNQAESHFAASYLGSSSPRTIRFGPVSAQDVCQYHDK